MYHNYLGLFFKEKGTLQNFTFHSLDLSLPTEVNALCIGFDSISQIFFFYRNNTNNPTLLDLINKSDIDILWKRVELKQDSPYREYTYLFDNSITFLQNPYSDSSEEDFSSEIEITFLD